MWTDEKHSSYLEHLEVSFVKRLHQSISLLPQCSNQDEGDKGIPQTHLVNARDTSEQLIAPVHGCREKINCNRGDPLSHVSVEPPIHIKRPWVYSERIGTKCPTASPRTPEPLTLCDTEKQPKIVESHQSDTSSQQFSSNSRYGDSLELVKEGSGQNFADEDSESNSLTKSGVKRLKTSSPE